MLVQFVHVSNLSKSLDVNILHRYFGHVAFPILQKIMHDCSPFTLSNKDLLFCEACQFGQCHWSHFTASTTKSLKLFELVHTDLWGLSPMESRKGLNTIFIL